jgi:rhodanese-related sulfurtransferase
VTPRGIDRARVLELMEQCAQIVEVLPAEEYDDKHLPGAVNLPLRELGAERAETLDRSRPVVVYCYDYQ